MTSAHDLTAIAIAMQTRIPVFLWGPPGVGKTSVLESMSRALHERMWTVLLSIREPQDLGGLPVITPKGVKLHPPLWANELIANKGGVVFFDEFNTSAPTTQSAALRVIYGGYAGDERLPSETTSFVLAGNRADQSAGGYDLTGAIANRMVHFDFTPDSNDWCAGMLSGWPDVAVRRLPKDWQDGIASKRGLTAAFITVKPTLLNALPASHSEQGKAWPSGRTWEYVATLLAACDSLGLAARSTEARLLVNGAIGEGAAKEFFHWLVNMDLPDPEAVLANPKKIDIPMRQDQIMALLDSVSAAAIDRNRSDKLREQRYYAAWQFIGRLCDDGVPDMTLPACRTLAKNMPASVDRNLPPETEKILPILKKSGVNFSREI